MSMTDAERKKAEYKKRRAERRCVLCGKQDERTLSGITKCEECSQSMKNYYQMRKKNHLCVKCGKQDAYTIAGRSRCCECSSREAEYSMKSYKAHCLKTGLSPSAELYRRHTALGLCGCGSCSKPALPDRKMCAYHLHKAAANSRRLKRRKREERGVFGERGVDICLYCDNPPMEDRKICPECLEKLRAKAAKNFANNSTQNHPWKDWNEITFRPRVRGDSNVQNLQPGG